MPILILVLLLAMAGIGAVGYLAVRKVNSEPEDFESRIDKAKLAEWEAAARNFDTSKSEQLIRENSDAWKAAKAANLAAREAFPGGLTVQAKLLSLDGYKNFDALAWLRENADAGEFEGWLDLSRQALSVWADLRPDFDKAGVMLADERDVKARAAAEAELSDALRHLCGGLIVKYSFTDAASGKSYANTQIVPAAEMSRLSGGIKEEYTDIISRHGFLTSQGYRCRRCGRSPLSGAYLKACDGPAGPECLCENCRGSA